MRQLVGGLVCAALLAGFALADDKDAAGNDAKGKHFTGTAQLWKEGTLTVKLEGDKAEIKEFKIADDVKVVVWQGDEKKESTAKEALKDLKPGAAVNVLLGDGDKVQSVRIGTPPKKAKS